MSNHILNKVCVLNIGNTHTIARTLAIAPYCSEIYYLDVCNAVSQKEFVDTPVIYKRPLEQRQAGILNLFKLIQVLQQINPDVIICFYPAGAWYLAALLYGRCPVVGVAMGSDVFYERGDLSVPWYWGLLRRAGLRRASMIFAKSQALKQRMLEYGVTCPIYVNYWGCDKKIFKPGPKPLAREKLDLPIDRFLMLSPRAISPLYRIYEILNAFKFARTLEPKLYLVIIGRTSESQRTYREKLIRFVEDCDLESHVKLVWDVERDAVADYVQATDVVVTAAKTEGFPNTVFEVMACERPVVAVKIPQLEELLIDRKNVLFCEPSIKDLANKLVFLCSSPDIQNNIIRGAKTTFLHYGDIEKNGQQVASLLSSFLSQHENGTSLSVKISLLIAYLLCACFDRIAKARMIIRKVWSQFRSLKKACHKCVE